MHILAVLNMQLRLQYFEDNTHWEAEIPIRARQLLEALCAQYFWKALSLPSESSTMPQPTTSTISTKTSMYMKLVRH